MNDGAGTPQAREVPRKKRRTRGFWVRQLHSWHWISSAIAMVGLLLFTVTGFTLNHAADISAEPVVRDGTATLSATSLAALNAPAGETGTQDEAARPIPDDVRAELSETTGLSVRADDAEWDDAEVYLALPRPGGDAWLAIDRADGAITWETTDRGWIAYLNDLHKGRDTGAVWRWFIDIFALGSLVFIGTGFVLMYLHSRNRPATWPVTGLGLLVPVLLALLFIH
ncbi:hypothetical protein B2G71_01745 [Novosphingobium sp. PC22D]|uniref:PepSY-associated TM helix domain-containing protein n=1 Tax=Novosphingobium sp. PC22D TaxID=1962403 RepID=UPI000BFAD1D0|nr:PepSY-associated TM helix domain-containing protein [Novosphingobium sp. PC22D]PEQ14347.1 hypothetical protein B2G71_01745 [Novosphingobium sp. PC22D]